MGLYDNYSAECHYNFRKLTYVTILVQEGTKIAGIRAHMTILMQNVTKCAGIAAHGYDYSAEKHYNSRSMACTTHFNA